jgi:serine/threonine protein kinase
MFPQMTIDGEAGGRWAIDDQKPLAISRRTTPFLGWAKDDESFKVFVQRLIHGDDWQADRDHMRKAFEIAQIPEIAACPFIAGAIDYADPYDTYLIHRLADAVLDERLRAAPLPSNEADEIAHNLAAALGVIHKLDLVHGDVREDNVLLIDGAWRLGDLGSVVKVGEPIGVLSRNRDYVPHGVDFGSLATPELDDHALSVVLSHLGGT